MNSEHKYWTVVVKPERETETRDGIEKRREPGQRANTMRSGSAKKYKENGGWKE